jgi:lipopolysaccharide kinase (Kdo/WaaP) family protein
VPLDLTKAGRFVVHPEFAGRLAALGLDSPERVLDLPGEVVSGHPDRQVVRIEIPGFPAALYLKRQHRVTRRERFRNWRAGFGCVSRSERERTILEQLAEAGLPCPRWVASGEDIRGRAFLLVEELTDAIDLREALRSGSRLPHERRALAARIGALISRHHEFGFTTPDLTAKHILISRSSGAISMIDWQSARRVGSVPMAHRVSALAALHASVADELATPRDRLRVLRAVLGSAPRAGFGQVRFSHLARGIGAEAARLAHRRSIRDQRTSRVVRQRLVWIAEEAVCAIPEVAAIWPIPAIAPPFYNEAPGSLTIRLADGRPAHLIRGRSFDPLGRMGCWLRGKSWRSPGARLGRILFHLERHGIPTPRLLAFGQRLTGSAGAEWFALHTLPPLPISSLTPELAEQLGRRLRQLHDAGCRLVGDPRRVFGMNEGVCIRDVTAIRLVKRLSWPIRLDDLRRTVLELPGPLLNSVRAGYMMEIEGRQTEEAIAASVTA